MQRKVEISFRGTKKFVVVENRPCVNCEAMGHESIQSHVFIKPGFWPKELLEQHPELARTIYLCLSCRMANHNLHNTLRLFLLLVFYELHVTDPQVAVRREVKNFETSLATS